MREKIIQQIEYKKYAMRFRDISKVFKPEGFNGLLPDEAYIDSVGIVERGKEELEFQVIRVYFKKEKAT